SRDRHHLARLQRYYHTDETLETNSTRRANQTPRVNLDRPRYGCAMQIPATTHGTVDQGGEKLERIARSRHDPQAQSFRPSVSDGTGDYCLGGTAGAGEYLEEHADFGNRMVGYNPSRGCVLLCSLGRSQRK
ncbi:unnamed protein product, partial [Penicillium nalgiovense]